MKIEIEVTDCRDCIFRKAHRGQGECWEECRHENSLGSYKNILWGCQENFKKTPEWCPLGIGNEN